MKRIIFLVLVLIAITAMSQNKKAIELFEKGVKAFEQKDFKLADSLFTLSAKIEPHQDTYFNLAAVKNELGDRCGFCENIDKSIALGNIDAMELYTKHCIKYDTLFYKNIVEPNVVFYCVKSEYFCSKITTYYVYKEYLEKGQKSSGSFIIDTNQYKISELYSTNYEIEKIFNENTIYTVVQELPGFLGGDEARLKFISNNIVYPKEALIKNIKGTVYVTFIVEKNGELSEVKILKGIGSGCDEECIRIVKLMPKWDPGKLNGKPVRVQLIMPIKFT
jgi:TonB family protein